MTINGIKIKKYRAKVKDSTQENGYKIVEGYASIAYATLPYEPNAQPTFVPIFVAEEINWNTMASSGFGVSTFRPMIYCDGEFEIVGVVD